MMRTNSKIWIAGLTALVLAGMGFLDIGDPSSALMAQTTGLSTTPPYLLTPYSTPRGSYLYQYRYVNGNYQSTWSSGDVGFQYGLSREMGSGDVDNDGTVEVYAIQDYLSRTERVGKNTVYYFKQKLVVFEPGAGSGGGPSWELDDLEDGETYNRNFGCLLADVDEDPSTKELVSLHCVSNVNNHVDVFRFSQGLKVYRQRCGSLGPTAWGVDAGDVDGDNRNEIVVAMSTLGAPYILNFDMANGFSAPVLAQKIPSNLFGPGLTSLSLGYARVRDVDNDDTMKEIVGFGTNGRLMIWTYDGAGGYSYVFVSDFLGNNTTSGGVDAGDVNGDGITEIVVGNEGASKALPSLWIFAHNGSTFGLSRSFKLTAAGVTNIEIGDLDADLADEIVVTLGGIQIFDFQEGFPLETGSLTQTYFNTRGGISRIFR
jgi:hypothetical protein